MAMQKVTAPVIKDSTGQQILSALQDIAEATQPTNVYVDIEVTLLESGWSNSAPYTYTWTSTQVTSECGVEVYFANGSENVLTPYIQYEKGSQSVVFTSPAKPNANIPVIIRILNAKADSINNVTDEMVSTSTISGASNVKQALTTINSDISSLNSKIDSRFIGITVDSNDTDMDKFANAFTQVKVLSPDIGKTYPIMITFLGTGLEGAFTGTFNATNYGFRFLVSDETHVFFGNFQKSNNTIINLNDLNSKIDGLKLKYSSVLPWGTYSAGEHTLTNSIAAGDTLRLLWGANGRYIMQAVPSSFANDEIVTITVPSGSCVIRFTANNKIVVDEASTESLRGIEKVYIGT